VEERSLQPYLFFHPAQPTRNLVFKNDLFELLVSCWEIGQASPVQSFPERTCWIAPATGRLRLQSFRVVEENESHCRLERADTFDLKKNRPAVISPAEPVHQVLNVPQFAQRAVSLHLYSPPVANHIVYSLDENRRTSVRPTYDSHHGRRDTPG
jgi:cysteine dioxygenase